MSVTDSTPGDGEPPSLAEKTKDWYKKHKPKVRFAFGVTLAVGLGLVVAARRHEGQDGEGYDAEDNQDRQPVSDRETTNTPRQSTLDPDRDPFLRRLPPGQQASEAAKERYRELTGNELPPGYTLVRRWFFLSPDDEDPSEAAA